MLHACKIRNRHLGTTNISFGPDKQVRLTIQTTLAISVLSRGSRFAIWLLIVTTLIITWMAGCRICRPQLKRNLSNIIHTTLSHDCSEISSSILQFYATASQVLILCLRRIDSRCLLFPSPKNTFENLQSCLTRLSTAFLYS